MGTPWSRFLDAPRGTIGRALDDLAAAAAETPTEDLTSATPAEDALAIETPPAGATSAEPVEDAPPCPDLAEEITVEAPCEEEGPGEYVEAAHPDTTRAGELARKLERELERERAEYANYKLRVDRDRDLQRDLAVSGVFQSALLPVLDDIHLARQHGDLTDGPGGAIAAKFEGLVDRLGLRQFGQAGDVFDPRIHEALMHTPAADPGAPSVTTVVQVLQPGYLMGERVIRAARVAVADLP